MNADVTVASGVTLTIEPGVTVEVKTPVQGSGRLTVNGSLQAVGTAGQPILISSGWGSPAAADWETIIFSPGSSNNMLDYVTVEYGGAFDPALNIQTSSLTLSNSTIQSNGQDGARITDASPTISNTTFQDNSRYGLALQGNSFPQLSNLSASGNSFDGIVIDGTTVNTDYTWGNGGLSRYQLRIDVTVNAGSTLTVAPGTTVFARTPVRGDGRLTINGTLEAQGTAGQPVTFTTGWAGPQRGDWEGLVFDASSSNSTLQYVTVEYGGAGMPMIDVATGSLTIQNSNISDSSNDGIQITAGSPTVTNNNIVDHDLLGLRNTNTSNPVNATCNWWGDASGPSHSSNSDGAGQQVSDGIVFDPWLVAPAPDGACSGGNPKVYLPLVIR
jgi:parallel beta-helix repeat protein